MKRKYSGLIVSVILLMALLLGGCGRQDSFLSAVKNGNYQTAIDIYEKKIAGHSGYETEAQQNLGRCLFYGDGCEANTQEAISWYRKAAEQGETGAMFNLGTCYMEGTGVKKNVQEAKNWFKRAASLGHERSAQLLEKLQKESAR